MNRSHALAVVVCLAVGGCRKPARAPVEPAPVATAAAGVTAHLNWTLRSNAGTAVVTQVARAPAECTVTCAMANAASWSRPECAGLDTDFRFVSDDCGQIAVLYEYPEIKGKTVDTEVGAVITPSNDPVPLRLNRFFQSTTKLKITGKHLMWLGGTLGVPGNKPAVSADGTAIEFVTIDQVPHSLTFAALAGWIDADL